MSGESESARVPVPVTLLQEGDRLLGSGDHQAAFRHFESLYLRYGDDPNVLVGMGMSSSALGVHDRAVRLLADSCLRRFVPQWALWLAQTYLRLDLDLAAYVLARALKDTSPAIAGLDRVKAEADSRFARGLDQHQLKHLLGLPPRQPSAEEIALQNSVAQLLGEDDNARALSESERLLRSFPDNAYLHQNAGLAAKRLKNLELAYRHYLSALALAPLVEGAISNMGNLLVVRKETVQAFALLEAGAIVRRDDGPLWGNLAVAYNAMQTAPWEAAFAAQRAVTLKGGDLAPNWSALAGALSRQGLIKPALAAFDQAIRCDPSRRFDRLFQLQYADNLSPEFIAAEHRAFGATLDVVPPRSSGAWNPIQPTLRRQLRVGFVSGDFKSHPVAYFAYSLLANIDPERFSVFLYMTSRDDDVVTRQFRELRASWRNVEQLDDDAFEDLIHDDKVDILIDLSGHTAYNRLLVFARKPAPLAVTWLGHPNTTGLSAIDWRFTDNNSDPPGSDRLYTEKLWRLPMGSAYTPLMRDPSLRNHSDYAVRPTPALRTGKITFGCCNNLSKLSDPTVETWARILERVPDSRLLLEAPGFHQREFCRSVIARFSAQGVSPEKLLLVNRKLEMQYLRYHEIDIALDPFPYNGGTTTCDLLWMGVPLVTLAGNSCASRIGVCYLTSLGRPDWIAATRDDYVRTAADLATDLEHLNATRLGLRAQFERSPAMNGPAFARSVEDALKAMWDIKVQETEAERTS